MGLYAMGIGEDAEDEAYTIIRKFWEILAKKKWDQLIELLAEDFEASWPQTRETMDAVSFVEANKNYPGSHVFEVGNMNHEYDRWDHSSWVITQTYIQSEIPEGKSSELYGISFFEIMHDENGEKKICRLVEYRADTYPAPKWRSQWAKVSAKRIM